MTCQLSTVLRLPNGRTSDELAAAFRHGYATAEDNPRSINSVVLVEAAASPVLLVSAPWVSGQAEQFAATNLPAIAGSASVMTYLLTVVAAIGLLASGILTHYSRPSVTVPADVWEARVWAGTIRILAEACASLDGDARMLVDDDLGRLYDELRTHYETFTMNGTHSPSGQYRAEEFACRVAEVCTRAEGCVRNGSAADFDSAGPGSNPGSPTTTTTTL